VVAAIFPVYFYTVAGAGLPAGAATARFALATTLGMVLTALLTPLLGAVADVGAARKKMLAGFMAAGAVATTGLLFVGRGNWLGALALFVVIELGLSGACVFYDSCSRTSRGGKRSIPYQRPRTRWGTSAAVCCWR
jgi:UMF1 family MFS transporter